MIRRVLASRPPAHIGGASVGGPGGGPLGRGRLARGLQLVGAAANRRGAVAPVEPVEPLPAPPGGASAWSVEESFAYCEGIARGHAESFPVASRFVPPVLRRYVWAIYAFARTADDYADEAYWAGRRAPALDHWEDQLERAFHGEAEHPIFVALRETAFRRDVPISPLRDLLTSFRMDLTTSRYATFESLLVYAQHSAASVGQLLLYTFDYRDPAMHRYADDISIALELTHFLQDLPIDLARDRLYLPEEDLRHFGVAEADLLAGRATRAVRDLMRFQVARARALFMRGRPLCDRVGRDLGFELNLIWHAGMAILDKIDAADGDVFGKRPALGRADQALMVLRSAARRWPRRDRLDHLDLPGDRNR